MNETRLPRQEDLASLHLLHEIDTNPGISQREISRRLGVSLGLTNILIRRVAHKAWIKITTVPGRRLLYALTPRGIAEKIQRGRDFVRLSFRYYAGTKHTIADRLRGTRIPRARVATVGGAEISQIIEEAVAEAGGNYVGPHSAGKKAHILIVMEKVSRALRETWEREGLVLIDLS